MSDDSALIQSMRENDGAAFAVSFQTYTDPIYRLALGLLGDPVEAEDVLQDTFVALISHLDRFEGRSRLSTWLYRVAYNKSMDLLRKIREIPLLEDSDVDVEEEILIPHNLVEWDLTPEVILADDEARSKLDLAIGEIPETLRAVFLLRDVEEISTADTAEALGISEGAVKVRLHRARLALRERLTGYFTE